MKKKPKIKLNYQYVSNDTQLEQSFEVLVESFYKSQKKVKEKIKKNATLSIKKR